MKITRKQLRKLINESVRLSFKPRATPYEKDQMKNTLSNLLGLDDNDIDSAIKDIEYSVLPQEDSCGHEDPPSDLSHSQYYTKFRNELDNEIELSIEPFDCGSAGQLTITLRGPSSESTNTITREEAIQLNEMLTLYLIEETSRDPNDLGLEKKPNQGTNAGLEKNYKPGDYEVLDYDMDDNQIPDHMETK